MTDEELLRSMVRPVTAHIDDYNQYVRRLWVREQQPKPTLGLVNLGSERDYDMMRAFCELEGWDADQVATTRRQFEIPDDIDAAAAKVSAQIAQQVKELLHGLPVLGKLSFASPVTVYIKWEAIYWESFLWCYAVRIPHKPAQLIQQREYAT